LGQAFGGEGVCCHACLLGWTPEPARPCLPYRDNQFPSFYLLPLPAPGGSGAYTLLTYGVTAGKVSQLLAANAIGTVGPFRLPHL
jgi:hypothetical protein